MLDVPGEDKARHSHVLVYRSLSRGHVWLETVKHQERKHRIREPSHSSREGVQTCVSCGLKTMLHLLQVLGCVKPHTVS